MDVQKFEFCLQKGIPNSLHCLVQCEVVLVAIAKHAGLVVSTLVLPDQVVVALLALATQEGAKVEHDDAPLVVLAHALHAHDKGKETGSRGVYEQPAGQREVTARVKLLLSKTASTVV